MTFAMLDKVLVNVLPKELQTKVIFDTVEEQTKKRPETTISGNFTKTGESADEPQLNGNHYTPILAEAPIFRKEIGASMSEETVERFIKIPRELFEDPNWKGMRLKYQRLFLIILENAAYTQRIYKHNGNAITVSPGQFCVSFRRLADIFNQDVKWKDERIDAPLVQRAVSVFSKFGFSIHESIHGIMRLTITQRELYEHFKRQTDTPSDTQPIQNRYTNEERKEGKDLKETIDGANALDSSLINLEKEEQKKGPSVFTPQPSKQSAALSEESQKHYKFLWEFVVKNSMNEGRTPNKKPGIKEQDLLNWIKKPYDPREILECLKMTLKCEPSKTWPGYVTKLLRDRIPKKEEDSQNGKKFVEDFIKKNRMKHIDMKQDYFKDLISNEQTYYNLPLQTIEAILKRSVERAREREEEDKRQQEYEDNY